MNNETVATSPFTRDLDHFTQERLRGRDMSSIWKDLVAKGYKEPELREIIRLIDRAEMRAMKRQQMRERSQQMLIGGTLLVLLGLLITGLTFWRAMDAGGGWFLLMYGPILGGGGMFLHGWLLRNSLNDHEFHA
jgi:hypothetical protein